MSEPSEDHSPPSPLNILPFDSEYPSSLPTVEIRHSSSDLCATCSSLPLQAVLGGVTPSIDIRIKVADVGTYYQKQPAYPPCALCSLLCGSRIDSPELTEKLNNDQGGEELVALSFLRHCYNTIGHGTPATCGNDSIMLTLAPSGFHRSDVHLLPSIRQALEQGAKNKGCLVARRINSREPPGITARIVSREFDRLLARSWVAYCQHHHKPLCSRTGREVAGLCLLDYHSLQVKPAPKHAPYVALSYVWGFPEMAELPFRFGGITKFGDLTSLPYTLADAIRVTIKLGFRYLWMDLCCID
ncbi:HET domain-containing protein [Fusarium sp. Ph1]|nr:HET domain-containing protein [Fusarium sp. Ph1]